MGHSRLLFIVAMTLVASCSSACSGCVDAAYDGPQNDPDFERPLDPEGNPLPCAKIPYYADGDGDGFGAGDAIYKQVCRLEEGESLEPGDCDDDDAQVYPGATERCDWTDRDCDGAPGHLTFQRPERLFTTRDNFPKHVAAVADGGSLAVTWRQREERDIRQLFQIVHPDGSASPPEPIELSRASEGRRDRHRIIWEPTSKTFILAERVLLHQRGADVFVRRYDLEANLVEPRRRFFSLPSGSETVSWSTRDGLVGASWSDGEHIDGESPRLWYMTWTIETGQVTPPIEVMVGPDEVTADEEVTLSWIVDRVEDGRSELVITWLARGENHERSGLTTLDMKTGARHGAHESFDASPIGWLVEVGEQVWRLRERAPAGTSHVLELARLDGLTWREVGSVDLQVSPPDHGITDVVMHDAGSGSVAFTRRLEDGTTRSVIHDFALGVGDAWSSEARIDINPAAYDQVGVGPFIDWDVLLAGEHLWYTLSSHGLTVLGLTDLETPDVSATLANAREWTPWAPVSILWEDRKRRWRAIFLDSNGDYLFDEPHPEFALATIDPHADAGALELSRSALPFSAVSYHAELAPEGVLMLGGPADANNLSPGGPRAGSRKRSLYGLESSKWREVEVSINPLEPCGSGCARRHAIAYSPDITRQVRHSGRNAWRFPLEEMYIQLTYDNLDPRSEPVTLTVGQIVGEQVVAERVHTLDEELRTDSIPRVFSLGAHHVVFLEPRPGASEIFLVSSEDFALEHVASLDNAVVSNNWAFSDPHTIWWTGRDAEDALVVYSVGERRGFAAHKTAHHVTETGRPYYGAALHGLPDGSMIMTWLDDSPERGAMRWQWFDVSGAPRFATPRVHAASEATLSHVEWLDGHVVFLGSDGRFIELTAYDNAGAQVAIAHTPEFARFGRITPWNNGSSLTIMTRSDGIDLIRPACALD